MCSDLPQQPQETDTLCHVLPPNGAWHTAAKAPEAKRRLRQRGHGQGPDGKTPRRPGRVEAASRLIETGPANSRPGSRALAKWGWQANGSHRKPRSPAWPAGSNPSPAKLLAGGMHGHLLAVRHTSETSESPSQPDCGLGRAGFVISLTERKNEAERGDWTRPRELSELGAHTPCDMELGCDML